MLPISYGDALPLLRAMAGPVAPPEWRGALPITYHLGSGPARVHLKLAFDWKLVPARDVIARLPGSDLADQWILRGNHYDAWVNGASDPISGQVAMLEEARAIGELAKSGWKPRRTLIFAAWDGEEQGLLGSSEWVETHFDELQKHGVVYINSDSNSRGFFDAAGSHTLERFVTDVARDVVDPERGVSVYERMRAHDMATASAEEARAIRDRRIIRLDALGSGSDFTPFLQHTGIAALNIGYSGEGEGGVYHSVYDSFDHFTRFRDPGFVYGIVQAKTTGRMMLRLANADLLPLETVTLADTVARYGDELAKLLDAMRASTEEKNRMGREHILELASDPQVPFTAPALLDPVPYLSFAPLQNAIAKLQATAKELDRVASSAGDAPSRKALDETFMGVERALLMPGGLPRRPWYAHSIYAPGFYTGYGVKTMPGVREAIEQRNWSEAAQQIEVLAGVLNRYEAELARAVAAGK